MGWKNPHFCLTLTADTVLYISLCFLTFFPSFLTRNNGHRQDTGLFLEKGEGRYWKCSLSGKYPMLLVYTTCYLDLDHNFILIFTYKLLWNPLQKLYSLNIQRISSHKFGKCAMKNFIVSILKYKKVKYECHKDGNRQIVIVLHTYRFRLLHLSWKSAYEKTVGKHLPR